MIIFFDKIKFDAKSIDTYKNSFFPNIDDVQIAYGQNVGSQLDALCSEDESYEFFCDVADRSIGSPISASARFCATSAECDSIFRTRIRAIYRASVWGQFSLLCTDISTPCELEKCAKICTEVFCELEGEGREFNGFIEKCALIDTPMTLYNLPQSSRFDLYCFNIERLCHLGTGGRACASGESEIARRIKKICKETDRREIAIKASSLKGAQRAINLLSELKINKIFI